MKTIILEIRASEGGEDAKLLVGDMMNIYNKTANNNKFNWRVLEERSGFVKIWISGKNPRKVFSNEVGNHRWQRVPPTENKGRVHTSSITVAILDDKQFEEVEITPDEYRIETTRGTGNGGQKRNKTESCVVITHLLTGIKVRRDSRSQSKNKEAALLELTERVNNFYRTGYDEVNVEERRDQIGNGKRGDKRRTYRVKDDLVKDHITNKSTSLKNILKGKIELLS